ncbi:2-keto-3-deoxy-galactonokinase [Rhodobacteraceae bacterium 2CG4]|uniref:2-keto-3-deoxy-galactonokinase n=1 Tax=Halovulum marinum TaxID=2662447 RepID=A0A6L5YYX7_9RHOB|nr:2-dehydro-3-deoxygalactonokinase [Halovulum marinum]MSU88894.1 2-keto-3-deoxy-galactonokinase [Halovulum marinum]
MTADWIAVDWGTSNLRAWAMQGDRPVAAGGSDKGMGALAPEQFEAALLESVSDWLGDGPTPVVACGMVGARQGWTEAPYRRVPCTPVDGAMVSAPAADPRLDVRIIAGLAQDRPADVMRGEETQIAGFLHRSPGFDGVLCLPGTHTKWVQISAGEVVSFRTFMTGEMFSLLAKQSVLRHTTAADGWDDEAFAEAVDEAIARPEMMAARLFGLRAGTLLHELPPERARARLSGLLIGAELAATRPYWLGQQVALIGAPGLARAYAEALRPQGVAAAQPDTTDITLAGLIAARALI